MCKSKIVAMIVAMMMLVGSSPNMLYAKDLKVETEKAVVQSTDNIPELESLTLGSKEKVVFDDTVIGLNTITKDNRKYVPLRELSEKLGYQVAFIAETKEIKVIKDIGEDFQKQVNLKVGDKVVTIGDKKVSNDAAPFILHETSTTYVPLRLISEAFGCEVDASGKYIVIDTKSGVTKAVRDALYDELVLSEWISEYTSLFNRFKEVGKAADQHANSKEVVHKQGGYSLLWDIHLDVVDFNNQLDNTLLRTKELDVTGLKTTMVDALKLIDSYCMETFNNSNWSNFQGDQYISDLLDLEVAYMKMEREYAAIVQSLNTGVK